MLLLLLLPPPLFISSLTTHARTHTHNPSTGKSTNLSKMCFWLLCNGLKVLIAACDTFRSGAVEQLGVHVRNLRKLREGVHLELFDRWVVLLLLLLLSMHGKDARTPC